MKRIIVLCSILLLLVPFAALAQDFCEGNFDCDPDVDGSDASVFKSDFGRSKLSNPCSFLDNCPTPWAPCPEGMIVCSNVCVDPQTNEAYCGSCNNSCASGEVCFAGTCYTGGVVIQYQASVPKTGQTTSYAPGDDGDLEKGVAWPNPRFTDNGDGTVTDNLTGLIWLKNANCFGDRNWNNALTDANGLNSGECGLTDGSIAGDWRLPNLFELESLRDMAYYNPALSNTVGTGQWTAGDPFYNVQFGIFSLYWSSTAYASIPSSAYSVFMGDGRVRYDTKSGSCCVWPVRSDN